MTLPSQFQRQGAEPLLTPAHPPPSPMYSGKQMLRADFLIFSANRSFLLRKRMMEVSMKNLLLQMESKSMRDSCMRF